MKYLNRFNESKIGKVKKYKDNLTLSKNLELIFNHKDKWQYLTDEEADEKFTDVLDEYECIDCTPKEILDIINSDNFEERFVLTNEYFIERIKFYSYLLSIILWIEPKIQELIDLGFIIQYNYKTLISQNITKDSFYISISLPDSYDDGVFSLNALCELFEAIKVVKGRIDIEMDEMDFSEIKIKVENLLN